MFSSKSIALAVHLLTVTLTTVLGKGTAPHEVDCTGAADGLHEIGCWGFANCLNGKPVINECGPNLVFDRNTMTCVKPGTSGNDCFLPVDCTGKADGRYPDYTDSCVTYYRCANEMNLGRFYCPAQTAFNEVYQICDYPQNLPPPCGTKIIPTQPMTSPTTVTTTPPPTTVTDTTTTTTIPPPTTQTATTTTTMQPTTAKTSQLVVILSTTTHTPVIPVVG